jgi:hypothetical protein
LKRKRARRDPPENRDAPVLGFYPNSESHGSTGLAPSFCNDIPASGADFEAMNANVIQNAIIECGQFAHRLPVGAPVLETLPDESEKVVAESVSGVDRRVHDFLKGRHTELRELGVVTLVLPQSMHGTILCNYSQRNLMRRS